MCQYTNRILNKKSVFYATNSIGFNIQPHKPDVFDLHSFVLAGIWGQSFSCLGGAAKELTSIVV